MRAQVNRLCASLLVVTIPCLGTVAGAKKPKLKPEDVIQRHLESLGSSEILAARKSFKAEGTVLFEVVTGGRGQLRGPSTFLCEGRKLRMSMVFDMNEYPGEQVSYDGDTVDVGWIQPGIRSEMGQFLYRFDEIVSEGLFGGALSTGWSLLYLESLQPKLKYEGLKKVDGTRYHAINYQRRKGTNVQTRLYFETKTFRHTHTIYRVRFSSPIVAGNPGASATQPETWYTLKESFGEFRDVRNLTLPTQWTIEFIKEIGTRGSLLRFTTLYRTMYPNAEIEPGQFDIQ